jgi:hypothetical protein
MYHLGIWIPLSIVSIIIIVCILCCMCAKNEETYARECENLLNDEFLRRLNRPMYLEDRTETITNYS